MAYNLARREPVVTPEPPESPIDGRRSYAEYLALDEANDDQKYEFVDGRIVPRAGASWEHGRLAGMVIHALVTQLNGRCEVSADARLYARELHVAFFPDVSVVCGPVEFDPVKKAILNPILIVEVLSPDSTEKRDRGEKFEFYKSIPSLKEYVLVSQHEPRIEVSRRQKRGGWSPHRAKVSGIVKLESIKCELVVKEVYARARG